MTDGQSLLLLFVALYFIECLRWLPGSCRLLIGSGGYWILRKPFQPVELAGGSPGLLGVLPPLQCHIRTQPWQLIPAAAGLELQAEDRLPQLVSWAEVRPVVDGRMLHIGPRHKIRCLSDGHARLARQQVESWLTLSQEAQEQDFLRSAEASLQAAPVKAQAAQTSEKTKRLRHLGAVIFVWAFMVIVALYRWLGDDVEVLWAGAGLLVLQAVQAVLFYRAAQGLPHRFWKALAVALLPQHAMRAADLLSDAPEQNLAALPPHPLAARALLGDAAWKKLACQFWKQVRYQPSATTDLKCRALEAFFEQEKLPLAELETAPVQQPGSAMFCPSCHAQFQAGAKVCQDCRGVELKPF